MGKSSQSKGRNAERELCSILQNAGFDVRVGKALNYGSEADIVGLPNIHVECKRCEQQRLGEWLAQADADSAKFNDGLPAIFWRRNRSKWCVVMELACWLKLYEGTYSRKID